MVSFLHAADLHLGLRLTRFGEEHARKIRDARIRAMENILAAATARRVDLVLIAGDLFDDAAVDRTTARRAFHILETATCPVYVLPGNHDPLLPGSVWEREPWSRADTKAVCVLRAAERVQVSNGVVLFPCPVFRKTSLDDPTAWIPAPSAEEGPSSIRIGVAHGSVQDRENLPPDDHPISPSAAAAHGLDYLALGHWHALHDYRGEDGAVRMAYCGVHEPMGFPGDADAGTGWVPYATAAERAEFRDDGRGRVLGVTIRGPGALPEIEAVNVGILTWQAESHSVHSEADLARVIRQTAQRPDTDRRILRLRLEGVLNATAMLRVNELRDVLQGRYLHGDLDEGSLRLEPSEEEVRDLVGRGVLRAVFDRLTESLGAAETLPEGSAEARQRQVAERAVRLLYQIASEVHP